MPFAPYDLFFLFSSVTIARTFVPVATSISWMGNPAVQPDSTAKSVRPSEHTSAIDVLIGALPFTAPVARSSR